MGVEEEIKEENSEQELFLNLLVTVKLQIHIRIMQKGKLGTSGSFPLVLWLH